MTPEEELELLIAEQQADDTFFVDRPAGEISLDAPAPNGEGTIGDMIGYDEEGELAVFMPLPPASSPIGNASQHGTIYAYKRLECRCVPCKAANAAYLAAYRKRRRDES
jgi:hypothetical protein